MTIINTQQGNGNAAENAVILPTDVYRMEIVTAIIEEDQYADARADGTKPEKLVITWEVSALLPEQQEAGDEAEAYLGAKVWQRFNPYYGPTREGVSRFQVFIDGLVSQGLIEDFDPLAFDTDDLLKIEQRVQVEQYIKSMGPNAGKPGNKVLAVMPLRRPKAAVKVAPAAKNRPVAVVEEAELPF